MRFFSILSLIGFLFMAASCAPHSTAGAQGDGQTAEPDEKSDPGGGAPQIPIGETGGMCGGIAGFQCLNEADYCAMEARQCIKIADAAGVCRAKPEVCTMDYQPVCGCDGETYSNACVAATNGVSGAYPGECRNYE